jgi:hypothetical protein
MFCPKCGASQPDGAQFCSECGANIAQGTPTPVSTVYSGAIVSKKEYISTMATPKTKKVVKLLPILVAVCLVVMILGHVCMLNTSMEDIPVVSMALSSTGDTDSFKEAKEELGDIIDEAEDTYDRNEDEIEDKLSKKELKFVEDLFKDLENCAKTFSINNIKSLFKTIEKVSETDAAEYLDLDDDVRELKEIIAIFDTVSNVMLVMSLLSLLFTVIGGLCRVKGLVIAGLIFSTIFCLIMYGWLFVLLNAASHIVLIKALGDINKEYNAYRKGAIPA